MPVSATSYLIFISAIVLEALLIGRLLKDNLWRHYPFLFAYVGYIILQSVGLIVVLWIAPRVYAPFYWYSGTINVGLRFIVIWEVFRQIFGEGSAARNVISKEFGLAALLLCSVIAGLLWGVEAYGRSHSVFVAMERSFSFVQAVLILTVLIVTNYYRLSVRRTIWRIAVGFGMFSSLTCVNFAWVDLVRDPAERFKVFAFWQTAVPAILVLMLAIWTRAIWADSFEENRTLQAPIATADDLHQWSQDWDRAVSTIRKVMNP